MFVNAIRMGRHMGVSRPILPPMPWPVYRNMTDEDLEAGFAYLRTIPPITNHVPDPVAPLNSALVTELSTSTSPSNTNARFIGLSTDMLRAPQSQAN